MRLLAESVDPIDEAHPTLFLSIPPNPEGAQVIQYEVSGSYAGKDAIGMEGIQL
jgi:hypothetical protein